MTPSTVGQVVKLFRTESGYTQWSLAKKLGVHAQYISNVERGSQVAPVSFVCRVITLMPTKFQIMLDDALRQEVNDRVSTRIEAKMAKVKKFRKKK